MGILSKFFGFSEKSKDLSFKVFSYRDKAVQYTITFNKSGDSDFSVSCNCPAGKKRKLCKHIIDILFEEPYHLSSNNAEDFPRVQILLMRSRKFSWAANKIQEAIQLRKFKEKYLNYNFSDFNKYETEKNYDDITFLPNRLENFLTIEELENYLLNEAFLVCKPEADSYYCWSKNIEYLGTIKIEDFKIKYPIGIKNTFNIKNKEFVVTFSKNKVLARYFISLKSHEFIPYFAMESVTKQKEEIVYTIKNYSSIPLE